MAAGSTGSHHSPTVTTASPFSRGTRRAVGGEDRGQSSVIRRVVVASQTRQRPTRYGSRGAPAVSFDALCTRSSIATSCFVSRRQLSHASVTAAERSLRPILDHPFCTECSPAAQFSTSADMVAVGAFLLSMTTPIRQTDHRWRPIRRTARLTSAPPTLGPRGLDGTNPRAVFRTPSVEPGTGGPTDGVPPRLPWEHSAGRRAACRYVPSASVALLYWARGPWLHVEYE